MNDICTYTIELSGQVDALDINAMSPLEVTVEKAELESTRISVCSDQAGLIGLMRHLHGIGLVVLWVHCQR